MKTGFYVEYFGSQLNQADVVAKAKAAWVEAGNKATALKKLDIYIKAEENMVYVVANDDVTLSFSVDDAKAYV